MIVLIPASRYRVEYQLASGRPYSDFERFILQAVADGICTMDSLVGTFRVHRRVVLEAIVTLMQAGWAAVDPDKSRFAITPLGTTALRSSDLPEGVRYEKRVVTVVMERVTGQLARAGDVRTQPRRVLQPYWDQAILVPKGRIRNVVPEGAVRPLLDHRHGEYIREIGPITPARDNADFVVVDAELDGDRVVFTGLTRPWEPYLQKVVAARLRKNLRERPGEEGIEESGRRDDGALRAYVQATEAASSPDELLDSPRWELQLGEHRLLAGGPAHLGELRRCLREARSFVGLVCGAIDQQTVQMLAGDLAGAVERGVVIVLIRGRGAEHQTGTTVRRSLQPVLQAQEAAGRLGGAINLSDGIADSSARLLCADPGGRFEAVVGGYEWLGKANRTHDRAVSVAVTHPGPVLGLAQILKELASGDRVLRSGSGVVILRNASARLSEQLSRRGGEHQPGSLSARLVIDLAHEIEVCEIVAQSQRSIAIGSSELTEGSLVVKQLTELLASREVEATIECAVSRGVWGDVGSELAAVERLGAKVIQREAEEVANYAVSDGTTVLITNQPPLARFSASRLPIGGAVGILLHGQRADSLAEALASRPT